jgi:non-ribosomal peptide synthetase-like protein
MLVCPTASNAIRWKEGERLDHLFERRCDRFDADGDPSHPAVIAESGTLSFRELDNRANQLARYLGDVGLRSGDRIGMMFDKTVDTYVALLAILKINAAYVPLDAGFPAERLAFIVRDANVKAVVSLSTFADRLDALPVPAHFLDTARSEIDLQATSRLSGSEKAPPADELCYVIYTSGTTGNPKGVAINHASICNFVAVAAEVYGYRPGDRVYQGMTIAFDFSVEELWVPLLAGATLVPGRSGTNLVGSDLAGYLKANRITAMCCVPTLLATIEEELPDLRLLLVSGEACPQHLVERWHRPGRTILNAYGPTEATVSATLTELHPGKPVTIGGPLPTYTIVILDENEERELPDGALGEIGIAGIGLAEGYLNRPDLTERKFVPDALGIPNNPSRRIYRTGDLGRINAGGEVEFHGRIDTQVKIRGYRIELSEIESVLMQVPQIAQAVVHTYSPEPGAVELVAYYTLRQGSSKPADADVVDTLRRQLPGYMVPAYLEELPVIPMSTSTKADRKSLPPPKGPRLSTRRAPFVAPKEGTESVLASALADVLKVEDISATDNFFHDLGAHSLLMARFCSVIRTRLNRPAVSIRDAYTHPTVETLAAYLETLPVEDDQASAPARPPLRVATNFEYYGCGALQLLSYLVYAAMLVWGLTRGLEWAVSDDASLARTYTRLVTIAVAFTVTLTALPIAMKWILIGRWREESFPVWSPAYFRFWLVKTLIRNSPIGLFAGSPIYNVLLRMLGARIGPHAVILSRGVPVCTDLVSIGANTIVNKDSLLVTYRAEANVIHTGRIDIGANACVGEAGVLDIDTAMGDGAQLGHASALARGQSIPAGKRYHGSPAVETDTDYDFVERRRCSSLRRGLYAAGQLATLLLLAMPLPVFILQQAGIYLADHVDAAIAHHETTPDVLAGLALQIVPISAAFYFGGLLLGLLSIFTLPRIANLLLTPDRTYPLFGLHYAAHRFVMSRSNSKTFNLLFGDSSAIVHYLRWLGYNLNEVIQTGSNFGTNQRQDNPFLCDIGTGSMISDGLSMMNAQMSSSSFKVSRVRIGDHNYLGNNVHVPPGARTGANCLLGTKTMIPIDGPLRENTGLLGSPPFEIPRFSERDRTFNRQFDEAERRRRIASKNWHNLRTALLYLGAGWAFSYVMLFAGYLALSAFDTYGVPAILVFGAVTMLFGILFAAFCEHASVGFKPLEPRIVSIYDPHFWRHERYWKFSTSWILMLFKGTPFKNWISRLLGVKVGRKVFDDGAYFVEKTLIRIGDNVNLNDVTLIQGHSLEEGVFKSDRIVIGNGSSIGTGALVHYGVTVGDNVTLAPDSFLMKGEIVPHGTDWGGNPARAVARASGAVARMKRLKEVSLEASAQQLAE